jgi:hypothetical protein
MRIVLYFKSVDISLRESIVSHNALFLLFTFVYYVKLTPYYGTFAMIFCDTYVYYNCC